MSDEVADALFVNALVMAQGNAAMAQLAAMLASFQKALVAQGFGPEAALQLCVTWLQVFTIQAYQQQKPS